MTDQPGEPQSFATLGQAVPAYRRILSFAMLNACNFQIALGAPLILMARKWGATSFYIGAITALVPLLTTLQIYMAPRVEYLGFRRVMMAGWLGRNIILIFVTALTFCTGWLPGSLLLKLLFISMFAFNALRGLATTSWLPWLSSLVPEQWRGRYISIEQIAINLTSAVVLFASGWVLGTDPTQTRFSLLFLFSLTAGWTSLLFLRRIEAPAPLPGKPTIEPIYVWARQVWSHQPFRRLIRMNLVMALAIAPWNTFTILFLRDRAGIPEGYILNITGVLALGIVLASWFWGILADRFGSRPIMSLATRLIFILMVCWMLMSMGVFPYSIGLVYAFFVVFGVGLIGFAIGNTRYCFNNAPKDIPVKALTIFSVSTSLCNAFGPILWGYLLTKMALFEKTVWVYDINNYTVFYFVSAVLLVVAKIMIRKLPDHQAPATHLVLYHMITDYPLRTINAIYKNVLPRNRKDTVPGNHND